MSFSLTWLPNVLKAAGLKVAPVDGWEDRGRGDVGPISGVICHYTEGSRRGNMPSLHTLVNGRTDPPLQGPLAQLGLGRDGTYYVISAGRCNHAGTGTWKGLTDGNGAFIGIEAENTGGADDFPWPEVQMDAYRRGVAAILRQVGCGAEFCAGHKEYARPRGRKIDPNFDMVAFRASVDAMLTGASPLEGEVIPANEPISGRPTLRRGATGALVEQVQATLGVAGPDVFGPKTEAAVRAFQRAHRLVPDGIVGPLTWAALDEAGTAPTPSGSPANAGRLAWGAAVSPEFRVKVRAIAAQIGCDPNDLMACIAFESAETFSPRKRNEKSGATGLIQFLPSTAMDLGTTTAALAEMSAEDQLDYVAKYFSWYPGVQTLDDLYMAILWPRAIRKPSGFVLFASPSVVYKQNSGLDKDRDGTVTKFEAAAAVRAKLEKGLASFLG